MKLEFEQILERNNNFHELFEKIDSCLSSGKKSENGFSFLSIPPINTANNMKYKLRNS